ncbi:hypothetical protein CSAL01_06238 [Colletotrichum salicis]|uniref:Uncharacterized protein n=1 Tax=Colletotrichum salicis TaxID=1209931 RepID=A0A135V6S6_9PEZI|nr:hypothetical protein CSAL01_06238 [Colletotrichum salicis]
MHQQSKPNKSTSKGGSASMKQQTHMGLEGQRHGVSRSGSSIVDDAYQPNQNSPKQKKDRNKAPSNMVAVDRPWPRSEEAQKARLISFGTPIDTSIHDPLCRWYYGDLADQSYNAIGEVEMPVRNWDVTPMSGEDEDVWPCGAPAGSDLVWYGSLR